MGGRGIPLFLRGFVALCDSNFLARSHEGTKIGIALEGSVG